MTEPHANGHPASRDAGPTTSPQDQDGFARELHSFILNSVVDRLSFFRDMMDRRRDVYDSCRLPRTNELTPQDYWEIFDRDPVAARAVEVIPKEVYQVHPEVFESEDPEDETAFEADWNALGDDLTGTSGVPSHYRPDQDKGHPLWRYCLRLEILKNVGRYGVMLLGFNDGKPLDQAFVPPAGDAKATKLLYVRVFAEVEAPIGQYVVDDTSPRNGQPEFYNIVFSQPSATGGLSNVGETSQSKRVHWTRVVHVPSDVIRSNDYVGVEFLRAILNNVIGLQKVLCSAPEMWWKNALPTLAFKTQAQTGGSVNMNLDELRSMMQRNDADLQRWIGLKGLDPQLLSAVVSDPNPHVQAQIEAICIKIGCPIRVFKGSERGELASSQDDAAWNDRLKEYGNNNSTPNTIVPVVDRLIWARCVAVPAAGYGVWWPDRTSQTNQEKTQVATATATAISTYVNGGGDAVLTPVDFMIKVLGWSEDEALQYQKNVLEASDANDESTPSPLLTNPAGLTGMMDLIKLAQAGSITEDQLKEQIMLFFGLEEAKVDDLLVGGLPEPPPPPPMLLPPGAGGKPPPKPPGGPGGAAKPPTAPPPGKPAPAAPATPAAKPAANTAAHGPTDNSFCGTGPGGGVDPTCSPGERSFGSPAAAESHFQSSYNTRLSRPSSMSDSEYTAAASHLATETDRLAAEYPTVRKALKLRSSTPQTLEVGTAGRFQGQAEAGKYTAFRGIQLDSAPVDPAAVPQVGAGRHTTGTDLGSVYRHELGHEVWETALSRVTRSAWIRLYDKSHAGSTAVSTYGGTHPNELFSESFSAYTSPHYRRGSLPGDIESFMDKALGRKPAANAAPAPAGNRYLSSQEECPHCGERLEMEPTTGVCNHCGKKWPDSMLMEVTANEYEAYDPDDPLPPGLTVNPFVSEAQRRLCWAKGDPRWDCKKWAKHTKRKKLPYHHKGANNTGDGPCPDCGAVANESHFASCKRDEKGHCLPGTGNLPGSLPHPGQHPAAPAPAPAKAPSEPAKATTEPHAAGRPNPAAAAPNPGTPAVAYPQGFTPQQPNNPSKKYRNEPNEALPNATRPELTLDQARAVQAYSGTALCPKVNSALRSGTTMTAAGQKVHEELQAAFARAKPLDKPVDVSRSITVDQATIAGIRAAAEHAAGTGGTMKMDGYISTATGGGTYSGNVKFKIKATHGLDMRPYSTFPGEYEMLLNHKSEFKVSKVEVVNGELHVHMEQVPPSGHNPQAVSGRKKGILERVTGRF